MAMGLRAYVCLHLNEICDLHVFLSFDSRALHVESHVQVSTVHVM